MVAPVAAATCRESQAALEETWHDCGAEPEKVKEELQRPAQSGFRNYENSKFQDRVQRTYYNIQSLHTVEGVRAKLDGFRRLDKAAMSVEEMFVLLDAVVDESDPDSDLPQSYHAYQTAESVMQRYFTKDRDSVQLRPDGIPIETFFSSTEWNELPDLARRTYKGKTLAGLYSNVADWSWFPLAALIHDLGKVCMERSFGGMPQWSGVGDTFVVGCDFDPSNIFADKNFYSDNPDSRNPSLQGKYGMYAPNCGLGHVLMSFGHDEYLALVLEGHERDVAERRAAGDRLPQRSLPKEAIYMIRFHSFYPWHTPRGAARGYTHLASEEDWHMLPLVKALQKSDLYSKAAELPPVEELQAFYGRLVREHFLPQLRW